MEEKLVSQKQMADKESMKQKLNADEEGLCELRIINATPSLKVEERRQAPPGSFGFPFLGETAAFYKPFKMPQVHPFIRSGIARYGSKTFSSSILGSKSVVTSDGALAKCVLAQEWSTFELSYPRFVQKIIGSAITTVNPAVWKSNRQAVIGLVQKSIHTRLDGKIDSIIREQIQSWPDCIVLVQKTKEVALKIAVAMMFENKVSSSNLFSKYLQLSENLVGIPVYVPGTKYYAALKARRGILKELEQSITKFPETAFLQDLHKRGVNHEDIPDVIGGILFAAFDTTGLTMSLAIKHIKEHPEVFHALKNEHNKLGIVSELSRDNHKNLKFTYNVVKETLRCSTSAFSLFRKARADYDLQEGNIIPKDWNIIISSTAIHMDEEYFENPGFFNPWRWEAETTHSKFFFAFGDGPRQCPGQEFAMLEVVTFIYHFLAHIRRWDELNEAAIYLDGTMKLEGGLPIKVFKY